MHTYHIYVYANICIYIYILKHIHMYRYTYICMYTKDIYSRHLEASGEAFKEASTYIYVFTWKPVAGHLRGINVYIYIHLEASGGASKEASTYIYM